MTWRDKKRLVQKQQQQKNNKEKNNFPNSVLVLVEKKRRKNLFQISLAALSEYGLQQYEWYKNVINVIWLEIIPRIKCRIKAKSFHLFLSNENFSCCFVSKLHKALKSEWESVHFFLFFFFLDFGLVEVSFCGLWLTCSSVTLKRILL